MSERLTSSLTQDAKRAAPLSGRNGIINGAFDVWQRGTSIAYGINAIVYHADRWASIRVTSPSGATISRQTSSLTGFQYCARVQRDVSNTATTTMYFGTNLESTDSYRFAGQKVTLSYYARAGANYSPTSSALSAFITTGTGTDQNFITGFTGATSTSSTATLTTNWQRFTVTATVASNVTQISANYSMNPVGTAGANDYFEITGVQLEVGSFATPFEFEDASTTLAKCQRYFQFYGGSGNYEFIGNGVCANSTSAYGSLDLVNPMRSAPSLDTAGYTNVNQFTLDEGTGNTRLNGLSINVASKQKVRFNCTVASGLTNSRYVAFLTYLSETGKLWLTSEL